MPRRLKKTCNYPGCGILVESGTPYCDKHKRSKNRNHKIYNYRWNKVRTGFLQNNPLCVKCKEKGIINPANVVDHIKPHNGSYSLFWDHTNWQALCYNCHNKKTAEENKK
jgi:5-methylcytosine-specific restriction protein A